MESLYSSNDSDVSPFKKFLETKQKTTMTPPQPPPSLPATTATATKTITTTTTTTTTATPDEESKGSGQKFKELVTHSKNKASDFVKETCEKWKSRFVEKLSNPTIQRNVSDNKDQPRKNNQSKIFVTRSSKEFAEFKIEEHFTGATPPTYIYPVLSACIVCFPYAMKQSGILIGTLLIFSVVVMLDYSEYLLVQCSLVSEERNVPMIAKNLFGQVGYMCYFAVPYFFQFSVLLSYFVILGDTSTKSINFILQLANPSFQLSRNTVLMMLSFVVVPLSMTRNIKRIFKWSLLSLSAVSLLVVAVVVKLFTIGDQIPTVLQVYHPLKSLGHHMLQSVSIITFGLSCQHAHRLCFISVNTNKEYDTNKPANIVSAYSILCTIVIAICGYTTFNVFTQGDILENYCEEDLLAGISRFIMTVFTLCLFPLECQNIRYMTEELVIVHQKFKQAFYIGVTIFVLVLTFLTSLFVDCFPLLLELSGFLLAIPLVFILPQLLFLKLFPGDLRDKEKIPCIVSVIFGVIITICGLVVTFLTPRSSCIHSTALLPYCNASSEFLGPLITLMSLNGTTANFSNESINFNMSSLEMYGFENLTDIVNAYLS